MQVPSSLPKTTTTLSYNYKNTSFNTSFAPQEYYQTKSPEDVYFIQALAGSAITAFGRYINNPAITSAGFGFVVWSTYNQVIKKDAMLDAFHKIAGGAQNFKKIPKIHFKEGIPIVEQISTFQWNDIKSLIFRSKTSDGRAVLIIKSSTTYNPKKKDVLAFIEKLGPEDFKPTLYDLPACVSNFINLFAHALFLKEDFYGYGSLKEKSFYNQNVYIHSYMKSEIANECVTLAKEYTEN